MVNLSSEFEMGMVIASVGTLLGMTTWLLFRHEPNKNNLLPLELKPIAEDKNEYNECETISKNAQKWIEHTQHSTSI